MRKSLLAITVAGVALGGSTACATKGYVNTQTRQVSTKVDALTAALEEAQERIRQNETTIAQARNMANIAAQSALAADTRAAQAGETARLASQRAAELTKTFEAASRRIVHEVVLSESVPGVKFDAATLPDEGKAQIDRMITSVLANPKGAHFEIEGHSDYFGTEDINDRIGLARAEAVKLYLYEEHKIPLHRINVISYGEDSPTNTAKTPSARADNRRL